MIEPVTPSAIGRSPARVDGLAKAMGLAPYADDQPVPEPLHVVAVESTVPRGRISAVDTTAASAVDGVVLVLTHENAPRTATADRELAVLQDDRVHFRGQVVAAVVATTVEAARAAAGAVVVDVAAEPFSVVVDPDELYAPDALNAGYPTDTDQGDLDRALAVADVVVDRTYTTARTYNSPMEPHATTATWTGDDLHVYESTQSVHGARDTLAEVFGVDPERVRVTCPFVGGGFGAKGLPHAGAVLCALAARALPGRAVRFAATRRQMFRITGYRPRITQRVRLAATVDGVLTGIGVDVVQETARLKEFAEQVPVAARMMYAAPHRRTSQRLAALDVPVPSWMRAPGEAPGMFALESAIDELAHACGLDPVDVRVRNEPLRDPATGKPFTSRGLVDCLHEGADRFGWYDRDPRVRTPRRGPWRVGRGVAAATYPAYRNAANSALVRFTDPGYRVEIGAADLGTGAWTALAQIAADALGVDVARVDLAIGDTRHPRASVAGGSSGTASWGTAIVEAARAFRDKFGAGAAAGDEVLADAPRNAVGDTHAAHAYGAQFAEVHVHEDTGEVRVARLHGHFDVGRVINPRTARSQLIGGMVMGMSMALHEDATMDAALGHTSNADLASYHVPTHADVLDITADWLGVPDPLLNPMGSKGIGEIGITGTAAAIANACFAATGVRVRELPITLDRFLR
ncbi:xanthine dehydrogenase family protein molybdopterin-binding subunit [Actinokineospora bangkokensis]|uniref:Xanthine dehydrogenase n=1 Tax=Actinokineospora bangkokensis TaxID=1193682 RepID=A0A1Q9LSP4_9PSEU|nr:xanthine dehydrogenase family protein molybdopterin-binding subunit [Actinokineospora bangkokensis]OLR95038.1 xanthine dehydrogenase [Actinokineospora bangkokensis]